MCCRALWRKAVLLTSGLWTVASGSVQLSSSLFHRSDVSSVCASFLWEQTCFFPPACLSDLYNLLLGCPLDSRLVMLVEMGIFYYQLLQEHTQKNRHSPSWTSKCLEKTEVRALSASFAAAFTLTLVEKLCPVGCHCSQDMK